MRYSANWLQDFVDCADVPTPVLVDRLVQTGTEVERVVEQPGAPAGVGVARVVQLERMPGSHHLWLTLVDTGDPEPLPVVCGAQNLALGGLVPWASPGTDLAAVGLRVGVRTIRGHGSQGMLCSPHELGLGSDHEGILLLEEGAAEPGTPLEVLVPPDRILELEITANRPDCLSHLGLARELAAALDRRLRPPELAPPPRVGRPAAELVTVAINDPSGCRRYRAEVVEGLTLAPSPLWIQQRLRAVGIRPLGLTVDLANYVGAELGQPLHTFDLDRVGGADGGVRVTVRRAVDGEPFQALDGGERRLDARDLVIDVGGSTAALAGIVGGRASGVGPATRRVLLEAATFDGPSIRATSRRLGLRTEASARFEKTLSPVLAALGGARFVHLAHRVAGAAVRPGPVDVEPLGPHRSVAIPVTASGLGRALGMPVAAGEAATALTRLGFEVTTAGDALTVTPPPDRLDVMIPADVLEEVGRSLGYERLPPTVPGRRRPALVVSPPAAREAVRDLIVGAGVDEAITVSLTSPSAQLALRPLAPPSPPLAVRNPLGPQWSALRQSCLPGLLQAAALNQARGAERIRLFEIGRAFWGASPSGLAEEPELLGLVDHVPAGEAVEAAARLRQLAALAVTVGARCADGPPEVRPQAVAGLHPGRSAELWAGGRRVGVVGELADGPRERFELRGRAAVAELRLDGWVVAGGPRPAARPLAATPGVVEDLAVVVPARAAVGPALAALRSVGIPECESVRLLDEYTDPRLGPGLKGWTFRLVFRDADRTLTGEEARRLRAAALETLAGAVGARQRETA